MANTPPKDAKTAAIIKSGDPDDTASLHCSLKLIYLEDLDSCYNAHSIQTFSNPRQRLHTYKVKLTYTGVYIIFLMFAENIDCKYSLEPCH